MNIPETIIRLHSIDVLRLIKADTEYIYIYIYADMKQNLPEKPSLAKTIVIKINK